MDVVAREGTVRCALCHEAVGSAATTSCAACATILHVECARDLARCPTLGCASPTFGTVRAGTSDDAVMPVLRWFLLGVVAPAVAFAFDAGMHLNPVAWGGFVLHAEPGEPFVVLGWPGLVLVLAAASMLGLGSLVLGRRGVATRVLLGVGVALATAHAVVFVPLLPLSLIGVLMMGFGLLGLTPFTTLWAYLSALGWTLPAAKTDVSPRRRRLMGQGLAMLAGLGLLALRAALPPSAYIAAPAARPLQGVDVAALRSAVAHLPPAPHHSPRDVATLPEPLRSVARGGEVTGTRDELVIQFPGDREGAAPGFPYGYRLHLIPDDHDPTEGSGHCVRWVEVQPGCWSEYVLKTVPRRAVKRFGEE